MTCRAQQKLSHAKMRHEAGGYPVPMLQWAAQLCYHAQPLERLIKRQVVSLAAVHKASQPCKQPMQYAHDKEPAQGT